MQTNGVEKEDYAQEHVLSFLFDGENRLPEPVSSIVVSSRDQAIKAFDEEGYSVTNKSIIDANYTGTLGDLISRYKGQINTKSTPNKVISFKL